VHATDVSNASRTLLVDLKTGQWDDGLLDLFQIPNSVLPEILPSSHQFGVTDAEWFGRPIAIGGVAGDQQAALFGQTCHHDGMAKNTYGTGCFMLMHTGDQPRASQRQLLTTIAWKTEGKLEYALEGSVFIAGAIVQWLRDGLGVIQHAREVEQLAREVPDSGGVYVVPALTGLGAPHWDPDARGTILGITRGTTKAHLARACLEGIAYQVADVLGAMEADSGIRVEQLRVDGGAAANDLLMQFQADLLQAPVVRPRVLETTALGAAYLAGLQAGIWQDRQELTKCWEAERVFEPLLAADRASELRMQWNRAVERSSGWSLPDA
jgi:glycerol kinase